jgi:ATP-dependent exoDNAse (exonuclease V) alpha subunit
VGWRERWAELANERLAELGHDIRVDHRSYAAQGIELEPQNTYSQPTPTLLSRTTAGSNAWPAQGAALVDFGRHCEH